MDPEETTDQPDAAGDDEKVVENERVDLSPEAIEARMAEKAKKRAAGDGEDDPAGEEAFPADDDDDEVDAAAKEGEGEDEKKPDAAGDEKPGDDDADKKSWQAKIKAEVDSVKAELDDAKKTASAAAEKATATEHEWMQAANETLIEVRTLEAENAHLREQLKRAGVEEDPKDAKVRELERELLKLKGGAGLHQQLQQATQRAQALQIGQQVQREVQTEAQGLIGKYVELKDGGVAEEVFGLWQAACDRAERAGKASPPMTKFVQKQIALLRMEKANAKTTTRRGPRDNRQPPRTLKANGSAAMPSKFPPTDEGIALWAKSRGYET